MLLVTGIFSAIFLCFLSLWIRWRKRKMSIFERNGIPGPKPNFLIGNLKEFHEARQKCVENWLERYGNIFGFFLGGKPCIMCTDVELLRIVEIKEFKNFCLRDVILPDAGVPHELSYKSVLIEKYENWKTVRSIISTCFSTRKIKMMSTLTTDPIRKFLRIIENKKEAFDIVEIYKKLTFDIICKTSLGITTDVQNEETSLFVQSLFDILSVDTANILSGISICFPEFEPIPTALRKFIDVARHMLNLSSARLVFNTCKKIVNYRTKSEYHTEDLMQAMIDAEDDSEERKQKLTQESVIANVVTFMLAGYDSTSNTLSWCMNHLVRNLEVQEKLRQEINEYVQKDNEIQYSDLKNFQYLDQVISETLRLSPLSILVVNRICQKDFTYKGMTIPKGATIIVPVIVLHKNPNYWKEPEKFDPDRFSPEKKGKIDPLVYQPFGVGPRSCPGIRLGQVILKLILANLIRSFKLEPYGDKEVGVSHSLFVPHPKNGVIIKTIPIL